MNKWASKIFICQHTNSHELQMIPQNEQTIIYSHAHFCCCSFLSSSYRLCLFLCFLCMYELTLKPHREATNHPQPPNVSLILFFHASSCVPHTVCLSTRCYFYSLYEVCWCKQITKYVLYTYIIRKYINPKKYRMQSTIKSKTRSMKITKEPSKKK